MVATAIYSATMVLWKETAFPLYRATERRWKRNVVSRVSGHKLVAIIQSKLNRHADGVGTGTISRPRAALCAAVTLPSTGIGAKMMAGDRSDCRPTDTPSSSVTFH